MSVLVDRIWPLTLAIAGFIVYNAEAIAELLQGQLEEAGGAFSWRSLLMIVIGLITMLRTFSRETARRLAAAEPFDLDNPGGNV